MTSSRTDEGPAPVESGATLKTQTSSATAQPPPPSDDTVRVTYIPETVRAQIAAQVKADVMNKARDENWAAPRLMPEWASRLRINGAHYTVFKAFLGADPDNLELALVRQQLLAIKDSPDYDDVRVIASPNLGNSLISSTKLPGPPVTFSR